MDPLYIFHHVFKTGGTTFNLSYAPGAFAPEELYILRGAAAPNREDILRAVSFSDEDRARLKLIAGHNTGDLRDSYPEARFLTLVRNPIDRAISAYLHSKHHEDSWEITGGRIQEEGITLGQFVEANWFDKSHNWQTRLLLGTEWAGRDSISEEECAAALGRRFHLAGCTESLELFLVYLHLTAGFPLVLFNNRLVRKERAKFRAAAEDLDIIERCNRLDRVLYRCARREFDRKIAAVWTVQTEQLYRDYLAALESYRLTTGRHPFAAPVRWAGSTSRAAQTAG